DDALLSLRNLDFQPFTSALLEITAPAPLSHDPFQSLLFGGLIHALSLAEKMIGVTQESVGLDDLFQQLLALLQINAKQRVAIEIKQVESVVGDRDAAALGSAPPAAEDAGALLHQAERRAAFHV